MQALRLLSKVPPVMRTTDWKYLVDALDLEFQQMYAKFAEKKTYYDIGNMTYDDIVALSQTLNFSFSTSVFTPDTDDYTTATLIGASLTVAGKRYIIVTLGSTNFVSYGAASNAVGVIFTATGPGSGTGTVSDATLIAFLRREVKELPFKIAYKSTVVLYQSFYRVLSRNGQIFSYIKNSFDKLFRQASAPLVGLDAADKTAPRVYPALTDYSGTILSFSGLDAGLTLDAGWGLDLAISQQTTNHFAIELVLDILTTKVTSAGSSTFLLTFGFFDFIEKNITFSRRAREVPHIGAQLGIIMDGSGKIDSPANPRAYTVPVIHVSAVTIPTYFTGILSAGDIKKISFGTGARALPSQGSPATPLPSSLAAKIMSVDVLAEEQLTAVPWMMVAGEYVGQTIGDFNLHSPSGYVGPGTGAGACDGANNTFSGTLPNAPLARGQVRLRFVHAVAATEITDDGLGNLSGGFALGTIDYNTGVYSFSTDFLNKVSPTIAVSTDPLIGGMTSVNATLTTDPGKTVTPGSIYVSYQIGGRHYVLHDNGIGPTGAFVLGDGLNPHVTAGSIVYATGVIYIAFNVALDYDSVNHVGLPVVAEYTFNRTYTPDAGSYIVAERYISLGTVDITEAGAFDALGNMVAYMTFPPVEFKSPNHHLNVHFFMHQGAFA